MMTFEMTGGAVGGRRQPGSQPAPKRVTSGRVGGEGGGKEWGIETCKPLN